MRLPFAGMAGKGIRQYVEHTFGRFSHLADGTASPVSPWTPMPAAGQTRLREHLEDTYSVGIKQVHVLDCGVCRVDRADRSKWIARVFPPARAFASTKDDAKVLAFLAASDFPAERLADAKPVSVVDDHAVLVTEFVDGKPPSGSRVMSRWIGDQLGRLHALPAKGAPTRAGGGWHHLSLDAGGRAADIAALTPLLDELAKTLDKDKRAALGVIQDALASLDLCHGLPQALVHVDFGGPNLLKGKDGNVTVIDWTGSGRGARIESLASVLLPMGPAGLDEIVKAYREHVAPSDEELDRLAGSLLTHQLVLAAWGTMFRPETIEPIANRLPAAHKAAGDTARKVAKLFAA